MATASTRSSRLSTSPTSSRKGESDPTPTPAAPLPLIHRLVTNWLITDPSYIVDPPKNARRYQTSGFSSTHIRYYFGGRFRSVKRFPLNFVVLAVILAAGALFFVFEAPWAWHHVHPAVPVMFAYVWLATLLHFVRALVSDPGVQPRNIHLPVDASLLQDSDYGGPDEYFNTVSLPFAADRVHGVSVKYCATCHIWRLPRMSHCAVCNTCVLHHDHHCVFLNNCVGAANYRTFLWTLAGCVAASVYLATVLFVHCFYYTWHVVPGSARPPSVHAALAHTPVSLLLAIAGCICTTYPLLLLMFHVYLSANNLTTREYLNYVHPQAGLAHPYVNVFRGRSMAHNLWRAWVAPPSVPLALQPRARYLAGDVTLERVAPLRSFNA